jgi:hypothetical protein
VRTGRLGAEDHAGSAPRRAVSWVLRALALVELTGTGSQRPAPILASKLRTLPGLRNRVYLIDYAATPAIPISLIHIIPSAPSLERTMYPNQRCGRVFAASLLRTISAYTGKQRYPLPIVILEVSLDLPLFI